MINGGLDADNIADNGVTTGKIANSAVSTAKIADDGVTATKIDWASTGADGGIWWEELGRTTLSGAGDTITVSTVAARRYLRVLVSALDTGGTIRAGLRFNNDSGTNYHQVHSDNFGAGSASTGITAIQLDLDANASPLLAEATVFNYATDEKVVQSHCVQADTAGATAPNIRDLVGKWANTANQITRIDVINIGTGDFAIGSEVVVLGHN